MQKDWKYIAYVGGAVALFLLLRLISPKQYDWTVTLLHDDKNPFGTYVLHQLMPSHFGKTKFQNSYQTAYELRDSLKDDENLIIICASFTCDKEDTNALLEHVSKGGNVFISSHNFWSEFADTLNLTTEDYFFSQLATYEVNRNDSSYLNFANNSLDTSTYFLYRRDNTHNYFGSFDTTRTTVIAKNDFQKPVTIRVKWGKGNFILNSTPLAFTNIYMMTSNNAEFASRTFSCLPQKDVVWMEYYQVGRREATTPLRFILGNEPLRWAYYIVLVTILVFMVFEAKRKQRIIPVVKPLANTTLEFVSTIGNLYFQNGDHKNIAEKKIQFLLEQIRSRYWLPTQLLDEKFLAALSSKSGHPLVQVQELFKTIGTISSKPAITKEELVDLNGKIEAFNNIQPVLRAEKSKKGK